MRIDVPSLAELVDPKRAALMLIDIQAHVDHAQHYIVDVPSTIDRVQRLTEMARAVGVTCIFTRAVERHETNTPVWVSRHVTKPHRLGTRLDGSPGAEFHPRVKPLPGELTMTKTRYSCFLGTPLEQVLAERGLDSLLIAGIATNVCVEVTARDAFQRDLWTTMISDCVATRTHEEQDRALLDTDRNWGIVASSEQIMAEWQRLPLAASANVTAHR
jgi:nicotinamidase-related amidase